MDDKKSARARIRVTRAALPCRDAAALSAMAASRLMADPVWKNCRCVALYSAIQRETDAAALLAAAWNEGKTVLLPRVVPGPEHRLQFLPCTPETPLIPGAFGIMEPDPSGVSVIPSPGLIIVPGLAFDRNGYRLGNGGGYYDRLFARPEYAAVTRIGFAYGFQVIDAIPGLESRDLPMHGFCTDEELVWL